MTSAPTNGNAGGLKVSDIVGGYGNQPVLHGLSLDVDPGTLVSVIGPNGHGKTTLLRAISGQVHLRSGQVLLNGMDLSGRPVDAITAAGIAHVPQGDLLFTGMTVYENLLMGAYLVRDRALLQSRLDQVFALLPKLAERRNQITDSLSGGERRMVGIGRGLMTGGQVLMLDEPSLGLAPIVIDTIYELVETLKADGRSILLVEESPERVVDFADRIYLLDNGEINWSGTATELSANDELLSTYLGV